MFQPLVAAAGRKYLQKALQKCKYPTWALNRVNIKRTGPTNKSRRDTTNSGSNNNQKPYMVVPYYKWLSESLKKVCSKLECGSILKEVIPSKPPGGSKRSRSYPEKSGVIGESSRAFGERFKEHQKALSSIYDHFNTTGHNTTIDNFSIVGREDQNLNRAIKKHCP